MSEIQAEGLSTAAQNTIKKTGQQTDNRSGTNEAEAAESWLSANQGDGSGGQSWLGGPQNGNETPGNGGNGQVTSGETAPSNSSGRRTGGR